MKQAIRNGARKSAEAAERTARLGTLRAQMEKVRRLDLTGAYAELGRRAYEVLACADRFGASFKQIAEVERQMDEKRKSVATDRYATIWERIKATAVSAKKQVEAEALAFRRKTLFESLGRAIADAGLDLPDLAPQQQAVARALARLERDVESGTDLADGLLACRGEFAAVAADFSRPRPRIGLIGEVYVRCHPFANEDTVRRVEQLGGEAVLPPFEEWLNLSLIHI